ncbi:MAG: DegV family protein, partial [Acidimicrobiales bacterium]
MAGIKVVTDSACDLTPQMAEERGARVVPLSIRFGDEEFIDREELTTKEFWDRVTTGTAMPETAAPSPGAFQLAFLEAADAGADGVACITLS